MQYVKQHTKKLVAFMLSLIILVGALPFSASAAENNSENNSDNNSISDNNVEELNYKNDLNGWKVKATWSNLSEEYEWETDVDASRQVKMMITYRINSAAKAYPANSLTFTVPGIGNSNRAYVKQATDIAGGDNTSEWSYTYNKSEDTYTFKNNYNISEGQSVNGGFEIIWTVSARETINNYSQSESVNFSDGDDSIVLPPLKFEFSSKRDTEVVNLVKTPINGEEYQLMDNDYVWYKVSNQFTETRFARNLYKSKYYVTLNLPENTSAEDIIIYDAKNYEEIKSEQLPLKRLNIEKIDDNYGFYLFEDRYGSFWNSSYLRYTPCNYLIGLKKDSFEGKTVNIKGHLDCLFDDENDWTVTPSSNEVYDTETNFTVQSYHFGSASDVIKAHKSTNGYYYTPYSSRLNFKELFDNKVITYTLNGTLKEDYGNPIYSSKSGNSSNKKDMDEGIGAGNNQNFTKRDIVLGDNKLAAVLKNGQVRSLSDDEYHFSGIVLDKFDNKTYELYVAKTQDELYGNYRLYQSGILNKTTTINFSDNSVKALYVKVIDAQGSVSYSPRVNVTFHFNSEEELNKDTELQIDPNQKIINFMYLRCYSEKDGKSSDVASSNNYSGTYAETLSEIDSTVFGNAVYRTSSELWLRPTSTSINSDTTIYQFEDASNRGYKTNISSTGILKSEDAGTIKRFSIITSVPSQLKVDTEKAVISVIGDLKAKESVEHYVSYKKHSKNNKTYIVADFDFSESPLDISEQISFRINYPATLSYYDYTDYGNYFQASTFVLNQDEGAEQISYISNNLSYDNEDYDNDGNTLEKGAYSSHSQSIIEHAREWREYTSLNAKSYYSDDYSADSITRMNNSSGTGNDSLSEYSYRMEFGVGADDVKNIVFYSDIENGAVVYENQMEKRINSEWQGTFSGVDLSRTEKIGLIPTIYYTTTANATRDITDAQWTTKMPSDKSQIKGIAIHLDTSNLEDGVLKSGQGVYVDINMVASANDNNVGKRAVNQFYTSYDAYGTNGELEQSYEMPSAETYVKLMRNIGKKTLRKVDLDSQIRGSDGNMTYTRITGAKINLYDSSQTLINSEPLQMSASGEYLIKNVECGTYYWEEVEAPVGYVKLNGLHSFTIDSYDDSVELIGNRRKPGTLSFHKDDADNGDSFISNAVYELYTSAGNLVSTTSENAYSTANDAVKSEFVTTDDGLNVVITNLPWGKYYLKEKTAPTGYILSDEKYEFTISKDNLTASVVVKDNEIKSTARLIKTSGKTDAPLNDAKFTLEKYNGDSWESLYGGETYKTNAVGEILVENLTFGHYRWNEIIPPVGYEKCESAEFTINAQNAGTTVTTRISDTQKKGAVKLVKKSTEGLLLKGAVYSLYTSEDVLVKEGLFTDEFGETPVVNELEWGDYYFKEDKAPNGYLLSNDKINFTVNARTSEYIQVAEATDEQQLGSVKLTKTNNYSDEKDKLLLEGAKFNLYKGSGELVNENLITNANGEIEVSNLEWGNYYFTEMQAPESYSVNSDKIRFSINASNAAKTQEVTCVDEQGLCEIKIHNEINEQYEPFGNAIFLFEVAGIDVEGNAHRYTKSLVLTNSQTSGSIVFSKIPSGTYQVYEKNVARYKQTAITSIEGNINTVNKTVDGSTKTVANVNLTTNSYAELKFSNNIRQYEKLSHNDLVVNVLNTSRKLIGITVDYKGANPISSKTSAVYTFKDTDLDITAHYDNGTSETVDFDDVELTPSTITSYENSTGVGYTVGVSYTENNITVEDSFNVQLDLKPLPPRSRVLFDANGGYFNNNGSSILNVSSYKYGNAATCVIDGLYEEPQNGTKCFVNWYTTPDFQEGTEVLVAATNLDDAANNLILYTDLEGNPIQFNRDVTLYAKWSEDGNLIKSGSCGTSATYKLFDNGLLLIEGSGEINSTIRNLPTSQRESIKRIVISEGITSIGDGAFNRCSNIKGIVIPKTVTNIGSYVVYECNNIDNIVVPDSVTNIGSSSFTSSSIKNLIMPSISNAGSNIQWSTVINLIVTDGPVPISTDKPLTASTSLKSVVIQNGITEIGNCAFRSHEHLKEITIPESVTTIGNAAFYGCTSLTSIKLPDGVTSIGSEAFCECSALTDVNIPDGVTSIGQGTFSSCTSLTEIEIPDSVTSIGDYAFSSCIGLTEITIPNSVTSIGDYAFLGCTGLTEITIPDSVTTVGGYVFRDCTSLSAVYIGSGLSNIKYEYSLFIGCNNLNVIKISEDNPYFDSRDNCNAIIKTAYNAIVCGCSGTTIPDTITDVYDFAFDGNLNFTSLYIPANVTSISSKAFNCKNVESIVVDENNPKFDSRNGCNAIINTASNSLVCGCKNTVIPNDITSIGAYAFGGCTQLSNVVIPSSVRTIDTYAFSYCIGLTKITIPDSVTSIGWNAFQHCYGLTNVAIPGTVKTPYGEIFANCNNLTSVTFEEGVPYIGTGMFKNCYNLTTISIPNSVTSIRSQAFYFCESLSSINIPNSVSSIGERAFSNCINLTNISIPNSVTSIGNYAFERCTGLTNVTLSNGVASIGDYAFQGCTDMTEITIPDSVTSIGRYAFSYCSSLSNITIPDSVTTIGDSAFYECTGLTNITISNNITSIERYTFYHCTNLTSVTIPDSVTSIGNYAFSNCNNLTSAIIGSGVTSIASNSFNYSQNCEIDCTNNSYAEQWCQSKNYQKVREHVYKVN